MNHLFEQYLKALEHASETKGKERHYNGEPFEKQTICRINRDVGIGYGLGQIIKKAKEVVKLPPDRGILEIYGIMNYTSGLGIILEERIVNKFKEEADFMNEYIMQMEIAKQYEQR